MAKFKIGDRVRVVRLDENDLRFGIKIGDTGIILDNDTDPYVRMDKYNKKLVNFYGLCEVGHEYCFYNHQLELIEEVKEEITDRAIVIPKSICKRIESMSDYNYTYYMLPNGMFINGCNYICEEVDEQMNTYNYLLGNDDNMPNHKTREYVECYKYDGGCVGGIELNNFVLDENERGMLFI